MKEQEYKYIVVAKTAVESEDLQNALNEHAKNQVPSWILDADGCWVICFEI